MNHQDLIISTSAALPRPAEDMAVQFVKDWTVGGWVIAIAIGVAAVLFTLAVPFLATLTEDLRYAAPAWILLVIAAVGAVGVLLILPGTMMRHVSTHPNVWWVAIPWAAVALFFWWWGAAQLGDTPMRWAGYVPAILIGIGVLIGAGYDALNRFASWIPTTVGAVLLGLLLIAVFVYVKARE